MQNTLHSVFRHQRTFLYLYLYFNLNLYFSSTMGPKCAGSIVNSAIRHKYLYIFVNIFVHLYLCFYLSLYFSSSMGLKRVGCIMCSSIRGHICSCIRICICVSRLKFFHIMVRHDVMLFYLFFIFCEVFQLDFVLIYLYL